jgi:thioredoxin 1
VGAGKPVTDASFVSDVLQSDKPVLVDFWAEWCAPCKKVDPLLNELANDPELNGQVEIVSINIDENPETTRAYQIMSVPTLTIFKGGQPFNSVIGAKPKSALKNFIQSAI